MSTRKRHGHDARAKALTTVLSADGIPDIIEHEADLGDRTRVLIRYPVTLRWRAILRIEQDVTTKGPRFTAHSVREHFEALRLANAIGKLSRFVRQLRKNQGFTWGRQQDGTKGWAA